MKEEEVISLSNKCNFNAITASPLKLEASARQYWRVTDSSNQSKILCYLDPDLGDHIDFINISNNLKKNDVSCSNVIHHNSELGITIQDDLGDDDLLSILTDSNKKHFLQESLKVLIKVQNTKISAIKIKSIEGSVVHKTNSLTEEVDIIFLGTKNSITSLSNLILISTAFLNLEVLNQ